MNNYDELENSSTFPQLYSSQAIGLTLKRMREERGLASSDVAYEANVHPSYYSMLENGHNCVSVKKLSGICKVHQISLSDFFDALEKEHGI